MSIIHILIIAIGFIMGFIIFPLFLYNNLQDPTTLPNILIIIFVIAIIMILILYIYELHDIPIV